MFKTKKLLFDRIFWAMELAKESERILKRFWFDRKTIQTPFMEISDESNTILSYIERTRTSFFEHRTNSNMFIYWWSNSNTLILASNDRTSNFKPNSAFTRFTKLLFGLIRTSLFRTSNELERVHLLVIELKRPIIGFERSNIEHCLTHHYKN